MKLCVSWKSGQASWDDYATLRYSYQIFPIKAGVTYQILFFRQKRYGHAAVVLDGDTIIIVGGESSRSTGEIVKRGECIPILAQSTEVNPFSLVKMAYLLQGSWDVINT